jgi:hypothetical protein
MMPQMPTAPVGPTDKKFWNNVIAQAKKQAKKDADTSLYYINLYKNGQFQQGQGASANHTFADVSLLMASMYARDPQIEVKPENLGDIEHFDALIQAGAFAERADAQEYYADTIERVESFVYRETRTAQHMNAALFLALTPGLAVGKVSFDIEAQCSRVDILMREELFIDPEARYDLSQAEYVCQCSTMSIERAKEFFKSIGCPMADKLEANFRLAEADGALGKMAKDNEPDSDGKPNYFRFYEIWHKAGAERKIYYRHYDKDEFIHTCDWPYVLAKDAFPYAVLAFNQQYTQVQDAFTDLHVVNALREAYEKGVEFYRSHIMRSIASKIIYDNTLIKKEDEESLADPKDMKFIGMALGGRNVNEAIQKLNLTDGAQDVINMIGSIKAIKDEVIGINDARRGAQGRKVSATQFQGEDKYGQTRIDKKQKLFDEFIEDIIMKRTQIDLQLMPVEKVRRIAGMMAAMVWSLYAGDVEELRCQYSIGITAGSTGEQAKQDQIQRFQKMFDMGNAVNQTQQMPVVDIVKVYKKILELEGIAHPERFFLAPLQPKVDPNVEQNPADPNAGTQPGGPNSQPMPPPPQRGGGPVDPNAGPRPEEMPIAPQSVMGR